MIEILTPFFQDSFLMSPEMMYRFSRGGKRYYYSASDLRQRMGITSFLSAVVTIPWYLDSWRLELGRQEAERIMKERANYGTVFHSFCAEILRFYTVTNKIDFNFNALESDVKLKFKDLYHSIDIEELKADLLSFIVMMTESNMKALLIENPLPSKTMMLAATLDIFCMMDIEIKGYWGETYKTGANAGQPKESKKKFRSLAIIDLKTARKKEIGADGEQANKAISLTNKLQLNYQLYFLLENYPQFLDKEIRLFNAIPSNWVTTPKMQLSEIEPIPAETLVKLYEVALTLYPDLFNVGEKKITEINGIYIDSVDNVLNSRTINEYLNYELNKKTI